MNITLHRCTVAHRFHSWRDGIECLYVRYTVTCNIDQGTKIAQWYVCERKLLLFMARFPEAIFQQYIARPYTVMASQDCHHHISTHRRPA
ncbi:hypothetical protein TNCV_4942951 [Trichonephila clavipes]|nr:hypothetical protein TNCV_4942951 [Trichonephila clavipes]